MSQSAIYLVTGFLGSGKTSLIRHLIEQLSGQGKRLALIVNEFGQVSIDGPMLQQPGLSLDMLNNGSIFCQCLSGRFVEALCRVAKEGPDIILVESTGLADPSGMQAIMSQVKRQGGDQLVYSGVICLIDAIHYLKLSRSLATLNRQILAATLIIINKTDQAGQEQLETIRSRISRLNPFARLVETEYGRIDPALLQHVHRSRLGRHLKSLNTPDSQPDTWLIQGPAVLPLSSWQNLVDHLQPACLRIKGFVLTPDGLIHIDGVADQVKYEPSPLSQDRSELVVIPRPEAGDLNLAATVSRQLGPGFSVSD